MVKCDNRMPVNDNLEPNQKTDKRLLKVINGAQYEIHTLDLRVLNLKTTFLGQESF